MTIRNGKVHLLPESLTAVIDTREKRPLDLSPLKTQRESDCGAQPSDLA